MARLVLVRGGRVENVITAGPRFRAEAAEFLAGFDHVHELPDELLSSDPQIGWIHEGGARFRREVVDTLDAADRDTRSKIGGGFEFAGRRFSLSLEAQASLTSAYLLRSELSYPLAWSTIDDATVQIPTAAALERLYAAAGAAIRAALDEGRQRKERIPR